MQTVTKTTTAAETMKRNKLSLREFDIYTITLNMFKTLNYSNSFSTVVEFFLFLCKAQSQAKST